jgi:hypothetical protein
MTYEIYFDTHFFGFGITWSNPEEDYERYICIDLPLLSIRFIF